MAVTPLPEVWIDRIQHLLGVGGLACVTWALVRRVGAIEQRRRVVPLRWFIENPFQNGTRSSALVREPMMEFLRREHPQSLARRRSEPGGSLVMTRRGGLDDVQADRLVGSDTGGSPQASPPP